MKIKQRRFPFSSNCAYDSVTYNQMKTRLSQSQAEENKAIAIPNPCLRLRQSFLHYITSDGNNTSSLNTEGWTYPDTWNELSLTSILSISPYLEELTMELLMYNRPRSATSFSFDLELQGMRIKGELTETFKPIFAPCFWMY